MIYNKDNRFGESTSPHSLGLRNNMTIPTPGWDSNPLMINEKRFWGAGMQGLTFDGTGLLGTGLFSGDITTWGFPELIVGIIGVYAVYSMFFQTKQLKREATSRLYARGKTRRTSRAARLRAQADRLETTEGFF
jgi:hypothetical protein